ncbi:hypothetical protein CVT24_003464 [Panaeolus cyanescens]|uniref:UvrD-like helicase ATP-binding domain-containing protein n=1 Tax=Panaeolus cyanescens TaxID=181874 RepID=A0A409Y7N9_9AGAR|nr:hypothetical protein CVT24_003464 [Panaeolus cyanescens]
MSITRKVKYRSDLFLNLASEEQVSDALNEFGAALNSNNFHLVIDDILSQPSILELVLSNISSEIPLTEWMVANFPPDGKSFLDSLASKVLDRLSTFFLVRRSSQTLPSGNPREVATFVSQAPQVFRALFAMTFVDELESPISLRPQMSTKSKANSQRQQKRLKKLSNNIQHEDVLRKANISIPQDKSDATDIAESILTRLRHMYETLLSAIRFPDVSKSIRESCITINPRLPLSVVIPIQQVSSTPAPPTTEAAPAPLMHLKLSQYYDTPDGFGEWNILVSNRAESTLRYYHRRDAKTYEIIRRKMIDLSNGHFSYDNHKRLNGPNTEIPVYEAKMTGDLRLIVSADTHQRLFSVLKLVDLEYIVDCIASPTDNQREMQALKVYDFCTHAKMDHRLWDSVANHLQSQGKEYRLRCLKRQRRVGDSGDVYVPASFPAREEDNKNEEDYSFVSDLVHQDNNELHSLITLEKYVALSKDVLESIEADRDGAFPFVLSPHERKIAEHPKSCYVLGRSGTGKTTTMLHKMLWVQRAYHQHMGDTQRPRQVFVTRSTVLAKKVEEHFSNYMVAGWSGSARTRFSQSSSSDLINQNTSSSWRESGMTFKGLSDSDFPLFIPLEELYFLLEGDIDWNEKPSDVLGSQYKPLSEYKGKSISFHRFLGEYWPTFTNRLTNMINPAVVFNEIIGVLLGSENSLKSEQGHLSREQYLQPSRAASSSFTQQQREIIYDIFALYLKAKRAKDDYDISDRSRTIITAFKYKALIVRKIDHLYVDETQDNLLIDAFVLRLLCRNPDGLFWAGDTAQTISAGSAFRFEDLKAFMFRLEEHRLKQEKKGGLVKQMSHIQPHVFQLAINYRSHAGIVDCANVMVEFIKKYFPSTIDVLERERGVVEGAKPMFCTQFDLEQFKEGGILSSYSLNGARIELGAQQCILVRDEAARERFLQELGDIGLIVTLYDSKGLEFNDVILLDFFKDSHLTRDQWSVVLNLAPGSLYAPKFDPVKHSAICLELKSLYVAITRARNNLRIVDSSDKSEPMRVLWEKLRCVTHASFQEAFKNFAVQSSREDWSKRAKELFDQDKYALSRDAYLRGQSYRHAAVASAYYERECAQRTPSQSIRKKGNLRCEKFKSAAEAFIRCADEAESKDGREKYYQIVAECYEEAEILPKAVEFYRLAHNFTCAAILLRKQGLFDEVKDILMTQGDNIEANIRENLKDVTCLYFVSSKEYSKMHDLFDNTEAEIEYLEDRDLDLAQVDLFLHHGRLADAAEVHLADERFDEAASLFISDTEGGTSSLQRAAQAILQGLRAYITFGFNPNTDRNATRLLLLSKDVPLDVWQLEDSLDELTVYKNMFYEPANRLYDVVDRLLLRNNFSMALVVLDYIFATPPEISDLFEVVKVARTLTYFSHYVELLRDAAFFVDPCDPSNHKPFGIMQHDGDTFSFRPGTPFAAIRKSRSNLLARHEIVAIFRKCLQQRLSQKVVDENKSCRRAAVFDPCLRHIALGDCDPIAQQCHRPHITTDEKWFHDWIRIHLLQIFIYDTVCRLEADDEVMRQQLFWLHKFNGCINPPHHAMGSLSCLTKELVQEMSKEFLTVRNWIRYITQHLDIHPDSRFLTMAMLSADLAFIFDGKEASIYMKRARFVQPGIASRKYLRFPGMQNSLQELLLAFEGIDVDSRLRGVIFIRHIILNQGQEIRVDINVLCTFIEKICGLLVVHNAYEHYQSFHNIMLPHSWLKRIIKEFDHTPNAPSKNKQCFGGMLRPLEVLIQKLHFGGGQSDHLLFSSKYVAIPSRIRRIYIARICRALGLLGYNIAIRGFREEILRIFKSLRSCQYIPSIYARYISSETFDDVAKVTRRSMMESNLDEMVEIKDLGKTEGNQAPIMGVRRILYCTEEDLATSLGLDGSPTGLENLEEVNVDSSIMPKNNSQEVGGDELAEFDPGKEMPEDENMEPTTQIPNDFYVTHSEEEISKACIIQRFIRRVQGRRMSREASGLQGRISKHFELCLRSLEGEKMIRMRNTSQYRLRYMAALPHLMACLDTLYDRLLAAKGKVKKQLQLGAHGVSLEDVSERYTRLRYSIKAVTKFRGMLSVVSHLHQRSDVEELQKQVQMIQDVVFDQNFGIPIAEDVKEGLEMVYRVVMPKLRKPTAKKSKRPKLVVEDELVVDLSYDSDMA